MVSLMLLERMRLVEQEHEREPLLMAVKEVGSSLLVHTQQTHLSCREQSWSCVQDFDGAVYSHGLSVHDKLMHTDR